MLPRLPAVNRGKKETPSPTITPWIVNGEGFAVSEPPLRAALFFDLVDEGANTERCQLIAV